MTTLELRSIEVQLRNFYFESNPFKDTELEYPIIEELHEKLVGYTVNFLKKQKHKDKLLFIEVDNRPPSKRKNKEAILFLCDLMRNIKKAEVIKRMILNNNKLNAKEILNSYEIFKSLDQHFGTDNLYGCAYGLHYDYIGLWAQTFPQDFGVPDEDIVILSNALFLALDFRDLIENNQRFISIEDQILKFKSKPDRIKKLEELITENLFVLNQEFINYLTNNKSDLIDYKWADFVQYRIEWEGITNSINFSDFKVYEKIINNINENLGHYQKSIIPSDHDSLAVCYSKFTPWLLQDGCGSCIDITSKIFPYASSYYLLDKNVDIISIGGFKNNEFNEIVAKAILFIMQDDNKPILLVEGVIGKKNIEKIKLKNGWSLMELIDNSVTEYARSKGLDTIMYNTSHGITLSDKLPNMFVKYIADKLKYKVNKDYIYIRHKNGVYEFRLTQERLPIPEHLPTHGDNDEIIWHKHNEEEVLRTTMLLREEHLYNKFLKRKRNSRIMLPPLYSSTFYEKERKTFNSAEGFCAVIESKI